MTIPWLSKANLLAAILLAFGFITALFFHGTDSALLAPSFLSFLGGITLLICLGVRAGVGLPVNAVTVTTGLYWLYLLATLPFSTAPFVSAIFVAIFSILPLLFFALLLAPGQLKLVGAFIGGLLALLAVNDVVQYLFLRDFLGQRAHWPLLDPNDMAAVIIMGFLPAVVFYFRTPGRLSFAVMTLFLGALVATESRGGIAAAAAGLLLLIGLGGRLVWGRRRALLALGGLLILAPLVMQLYGLFFHGNGALHNFAKPSPNSTTDRIAMWLASWRMLRAHPWQGPGLGTFFYYYSRYRQSSDQSDGFFAHNDPLQMAAEVGFMLPLLFYAVMVAVLARTVRILRLPDLPADRRLLLAGAFATLAAEAIHAHLNFNLYLPAILAPLACVLAIWHRLAETAAPKIIVAENARQRRVVLASVIACALLAGQWLACAGFGIYEINRAVAAEGGNDFDGMRLAVDRAAALAPGTYDRVPQYRMRVDAAMLNAASSLDPAAQAALYADGLRAIHRAQSLNTGFADLAAEEARLEALAWEKKLNPEGQNRAIDLLKNVLRQDPLDLSARAALADLYQRRGELKNALAVQIEGLHWPRPKGQPDINFLVATAELARATGDQETFQILINQAGAEAMQYGLTTSK